MTRARCCVPFCRHTRAVPSTWTSTHEWICGDHWRAIDKPYRRVWGRYKRKWRRFGPAITEMVMTDAEYRVWCRLKRQAIERAGGI